MSHLPEEHPERFDTAPGERPVLSRACCYMLCRLGKSLVHRACSVLCAQLTSVQLIWLPSKVVDTLTKMAPDNAVMCVDVGNNAYSFGRYFESNKQTFLMSGYLGSIGFAFPAAMGAWAAVGNDRPIIAVAGDGGFCQYLAELTTAVKYKMPIKVIILNNNELGKISKEQKAGEFDVWATDLVNPDFAEYANGCGALGIKVTKKEELSKAMETLFNHDGPGLIEVKTDVKLI